MLHKVTFHNDHSVKTKTTRQYLDVYIQSNLKQSQNQAEKLKKLADVKRKVNFWCSQVEAFLNQKSVIDLWSFLMQRFLFETEKSGPPFILSLKLLYVEWVAWKITSCNTWVRLENKPVLKLISSTRDIDKSPGEMLVLVTLYVSNNKKNEYQWDTVKTAFTRTEN